ncbi:MAG: type I methionyl aminopeptidase [Spirochaetia bacterium]|nr:type I methionyl aminopeptidase [Spirochaetia bacterium]
MIIIKTKEEIDGIRKSCHLLARLMGEVGEKIRPGMTTKQIDQWVYRFITDHGGKPAFLHYGGFPASACISVNDEVIHGIPGNRRLEEGDIVGMDLGINLNGFFSDMARTFPVGKVCADAEKLMKVTFECLDKGIAAARFGNRIKDISRAVSAHARAYGYGVVRDYCGHGVGLKVHEEPEVPNYCEFAGKNPRLQAGMVIAIEPMINAGTYDVDVLDDDWTVVTCDGSLSAHFEDTVAIFPDHTEILTRL